MPSLTLEHNIGTWRTTVDLFVATPSPRLTETLLSDTVNSFPVQPPSSPHWGLGSHFILTGPGGDGDITTIQPCLIQFSFFDRTQHWDTPPDRELGSPRLLTGPGGVLYNTINFSGHNRHTTEIFHWTVVPYGHLHYTLAYTLRLQTSLLPPNWGLGSLLHLAGLGGERQQDSVFSLPIFILGLLAQPEISDLSGILLSTHFCGLQINAWCPDSSLLQPGSGDLPAAGGGAHSGFLRLEVYTLCSCQCALAQVDLSTFFPKNPKLSWLHPAALHPCILIAVVLLWLYPLGFGAAPLRFLIHLIIQLIHSHPYNPISVIFPSRPHQLPNHSGGVRRKPGPKSGHTWISAVFRLTILVLPICIVMCQNLESWYGGEGFVPLPSWNKRADCCDDALMRLLSAKPDGHTLPKGYGLDPVSQTPRKNSILKRSFGRAYKRACQFGITWYRGQLLRRCDFPADLPIPPSAPPLKPRGPVPMHSRKAPRGRLNIVHHNVGGLSSYKLDEIKMWAFCVEADLVVLTETRWGFESEWSDSAWHHIHVGNTTDRSAGILLLIRSTVCPADRIGYASLYTGRLLHLRIHFPSRALDLLCCYQFMDDRTAHRRKQHAELWHCLDQYVAHLPRRNQFLLAGDFNCSLHQDAGHVGTSYCTWHGRQHLGPQHQDRPTFQAFLRKHALVAINAWRNSDPPTFESAIAASRIDFFIMRSSDVDGVGREVHSFPNAPFVPVAGSRHLPLMCSIKKSPRFFCPTGDHLELYISSETGVPTCLPATNPQLERFDAHYCCGCHSPACDRCPR